MAGVTSLIKRMLLLMKVSFLGCILYLQCSYAVNIDCSISFPKQNDTNQPLILRNNSNVLRFTIPINGSLGIKSEETVGVYCPRTNRFSNTDTQWMTCVQGENFRSGNITRKFEDLGCSTVSKGSVYQTNTTCGNGFGRTLLIGYQISNNQWTSLIKVCYNSSESRTLYVEHILYSSALSVISKQKFRPRFSQEGFTLNGSVDRLYKQNAQLRTFTRVLGGKGAARRYLINNESYLSRGHLAPKGDMIYASWQTTTFFFINACPQWQVINGGNWNKIEQHIRNTAKHYQEPLKILTGTYDILSIADAKGKFQKLYLDTKARKIPVPKFIWKIVYSTRTQRGIAFVILNNPFIKQISSEDIICNNICSFDSFQLKNGYFYCCDIRELRDIVPTIPKLTVKGILTDFTKICNRKSMKEYVNTTINVYVL